MYKPIVLTQEEISIKSNVPDWLSREYEEFQKKVLNKEFPCYFGTNAERAGHLRYTYVEQDSVDHLIYTMLKFLELSRTHPTIRYALVLFVEPESIAQSLDFYQEKFWKLLQWLHNNDPEPWPQDVPQDPDDPRWEYCFAGEPMFVFSSTPSYQGRASRHLGRSLVLLFQPRRVFHGIEGGTPGGTIAREKIRAKMLKYDNMPFHPNMGSYGDPSSFEWKQYFLPDDNTPVTGKCPLHLHENISRAKLEVSASREED